MLAIALTVFCGIHAAVVKEEGSAQIRVPEKAISEHSLIVDIPEKDQFSDWSKQDHRDSFSLLQRVVNCWKKKEIADQFLIYGKVTQNSSFKWEIVPHFTRSFSISRFYQQFWTLWGVTFPKERLYEEEREERARFYQKLLSERHESLASEEEIFTDPLCNPKVIEKQWVYQGKTVHVLYDYRPIGFGGEKLHFLFIPKKHRTTFYELTEEEYQEALSLAQKFVHCFTESRPIQEAHIYHKTGKDAGQTVPHWHLHLVFTTNHFQGCCGRLTVLRNMLLRPNSLSDEKLKEKVDKYRDEFISCLSYE